MRIKSLSILALLFALTVGNMNAQNATQQPQNLRDGGWLTQDFEDNDMHGWTFQDSQGASGGGMIVTVDNHTPEGKYSFRISGSQKYRYLISPELTNTESGVKVNFWYTNHYGNGNTSEIQVGYSTTSDNLGSFTWGNPLDILCNRYNMQIF